MLVEELKPGSSHESGSPGPGAGLGPGLGLDGDGNRPHRIGGYRILREIGRGGMGIVYEAEQEALGRRVALKVLPGALGGDPKARARFDRVARAAARMHHTNIVPVFDVGQDGGQVFYAMQMIQGQGLDLVIEELKRLRDQSGAASPRADLEPDQSLAASLILGRFERENLAGTPTRAALHPAPTTGQPTTRGATRPRPCCRASLNSQVPRATGGLITEAWPRSACRPQSP